MEIEEIGEGNTLTLILKGRVDGLGAGALEKRMNEAFARMTADYKQVKVLAFDFEGVNYLSSAGLRVLLIASKHLAQKGGETRLLNVSPEIMGILAMTGFDKIMKIQKKG